MNNQTDFVGSSSFAIGLKNTIARFAPLESPVMIYGPTGSGKTIVTEQLHKHSNRIGQLVALDCTTTPEALFESELFGSRKGAFTGATDSKGIISYADQGTLWLDEIGELSLTCQNKLLRLLDGKYRPIGAREDKDLNSRIIASTNMDLRKMVEQRKFREDLFYRLQRLQIKIPPLKERRQDILPTLEHCVKTCESNRAGKAVLEVSESSLEMLKHYEWPGNVREMEAVVLNAFLLFEEMPKKSISTNDILKALTQMEGPMESLLSTNAPRFTGTLEEIERQVIYQALMDNKWSIARVAEQLGITDRTVQNKMKKYNFQRTAVLKILTKEAAV